MNTPIAVGGVAVCPGDLIVGDADGVIVIPLGDAEAVLNKAKEYAKFDASKVEAAKNGTANRLWVKNHWMRPALSLSTTCIVNLIK